MAPESFNVQPNRFLLRIYTRSYGLIEIVNTQFEGIGKISERNEPFNTFAHQVHLLAHAANPSIRFLRGTNWLNYIFSLLMTAVIGLIVVLLGIYFLMAGAFIIALVKLLILPFFTPLLFRYLKNNKPGSYDPLQIPEQLLPKKQPSE